MVRGQGEGMGGEGGGVATQRRMGCTREPRVREVRKGERKEGRKARETERKRTRKGREELD